MRWSSIAAAVYGAAASVAAIDPVEVYGNKFFNKDGSQFFMKGVAYQLVPDDPLVDTEQCKLDAKLMEELGANTIRVYHVDASKDHDGCMKAFADVGIYVLMDLDTFSTYILPQDLYWNGTQYDKYRDVMDTFQGYNNVLGFFIGNENIAKKDDSPAAPFLKAAARDMKAYRDAKGYRKIPVGYSAADILELRPMLQNYLTCGGNSSEIIDFFSLNSYSYCGDSSYTISSYDQLEKYAVDFPVPIFFSETGCNVVQPRDWADQDLIFGKQMVHDWSGAIIYEWIQEENDYGIITYGPPAGDDASGADVVGGFTRKGTPTPKSPDFPNLKTKWASLNPTGVSKSDYNPKDVSTRACPTSTAGGWWVVNGNVRLPNLGEELDNVHPTFTTMPVATADPSDDAPTSGNAPAATSAAGQDGSSNGKGGKDGKDGNDSATADRQIAAMGVLVAGATLFFSIWL